MKNTLHGINSNQIKQKNGSVISKKGQRKSPNCKAKKKKRGSFKAMIPHHLDTRHGFHGRQLFPWTGEGDGFRMIQAHCIYCVLYFYYYYISSTSDHQALDPGGCGPLSYKNTNPICQGPSFMTSFNLNYFLISPVSKHRHLRGYSTYESGPGPQFGSQHY